MEQLIDKSALVVEIEKMKKKAYPNSDWNHGYVTSCEKILSFIDTLEVKDVDLEKEIKKYIEDNICGYCIPGVEETARHFFKLGLKAQKL